MCDDNKMTAGADAAPVETPKLKLSEIFRAVRAKEVEIDVKGCVLLCDMDSVTTVCDMDRLSIGNRDDVRLSMVHHGASELIRAVMQGDGKAVAVVAEYALGEDHCRMAGVLRVLAGRNDDREEGADNE